MKLTIVDAGIGWGAAYEEAQTKFIKLGGELVTEVFVSEGWDIKIRLPADAKITIERDRNFPLMVTIPNPKG